MERWKLAWRLISIRSRAHWKAFPFPAPTSLTGVMNGLCLRHSESGRRWQSCGVREFCRKASPSSATFLGIFTFHARRNGGGEDVSVVLVRTYVRHKVSMELMDKLTDNNNNTKQIKLRRTCCWPNAISANLCCRGNWTSLNNALRPQATSKLPTKSFFVH